ncbi:Dehydratase OS=Streptomyces fumanus OX=67302 GN=GCM10018772_02020 PE=4 SV=1 [Streptomyces fumanus]
MWQLLGGKVTDKVKAYANGWYTTERTPEAYHKAARGVMERGYRALKIDPFGTGHFELDAQQTRYAVSLIEAVRDAIGPDAELMLEMHGRFSPATAVRLAKELAPYKPAWLEEPVPPENLRALKKVAEKVDLPVATGERIHDRIEFRELFEDQSVDIVQSGRRSHRRHLGDPEAGRDRRDPLHAGRPAQRGRVGADRRLAPGRLHLAELQDPRALQRLRGRGDQEGGEGRSAGEPGGRVLPPVRRAGLGVELDTDAAAEFPQQQARFDLWAEGWEQRKPKATKA